MVLGVGLTVYIAACQLKEGISWDPYGRTTERTQGVLRLPSLCSLSRASP